MAVNLSKENRTVTPWWPKREPSEILKSMAEERLCQYPITSLASVQERTKLYPEHCEIREMMEGFFGAISFGSGDEKSTAPQSLGYTLFAPEQRLHHKIKSFFVPVGRWIFDDDGMWLNPLTPQLISLDDTEARQLFGLENINYDIWVIPVHEDCYAGEGREWLKSNCIVTDLTAWFTNALFCMVRVSFDEAQKLPDILGDQHGFFLCMDSEGVTATWLMPWKKSRRIGSCSANAQRVDAWRKTTAQEDCLYPNSYSVKYDKIVKDWTERGKVEDALRAKQEYRAQIPESRRRFKEEDLYNKAKAAGYVLSTAGDEENTAGEEEAVLYREEIKLSPGRKPKRIRTFQRKFPISPDGVIMVKNFLRLHKVVEEEFSNENLLEMHTKGLTFKFEEKELTPEDDSNSLA